jgi:GNAT superfamily N-acetyltransferase
MSRQPGPDALQMPPMSRLYGYVRSRQLEGTYPGNRETGAWGLTALRVLRAFGYLPEEKWPYDTTQWPPVEPPGVDRIAKKYRLHYYQRVRDIDECRKVLDAVGAFSASFEVDLLQWSSARNGKIKMPNVDQPLSGAHHVLIVGYDDDVQQLKFVNSWGSDWGEGGYGYMPYEYFTRFLQEAWAIPGGGRPYLEPPGRSDVQPGGMHVLEWGVPDAMGSQIHGVEIDDLTFDDHQAWAFAVARNGYLDVEELFVRPEWRRRGHGAQLIRVMQGRAAMLDLPLRFWVPHADGVGSNTLPTFCRLMRQIDLRIDESEVEWASFVVT